MDTSEATWRIDHGCPEMRRASKKVDLKRGHFLAKPSWLRVSLGASEIRPIDSGFVIVA
jgi:hypothetical protein